MSHLDINKVDFNKIFAKLADYSKVIQPNPYDIVICDAFTVHASPIMDIDTWRTFLRIEFSEKIYNRKFNTMNPLFDYSWDYIDRHNPTNLE